jgi:hypothetical protein
MVVGIRRRGLSVLFGAPSAIAFIPLPAVRELADLGGANKKLVVAQAAKGVISTA